MDLLTTYRYHFDEDPQADGRPLTPAALLGPEVSDRSVEFNSPEAAGRFFLSAKLGQEESPELHSLVTDGSPAGLVPDLLFRGQRRQPATGTTLVRYDQTHRDIPLWGAETVVELDDQHALVSVNGRFGRVEGPGVVPALSVREAFQRVEAEVGRPVDAEELPPATLAYFGRADGWRLAWYLREVPEPPAGMRRPAGMPGHGMDPSPRDDQPLTGFLVDALTGEILFAFGMAPTAAAPADLKGEDEAAVAHDFAGSRQDGTYYLEEIGARRISTFDMGFKDLSSTPPPPLPVGSPDADFGATQRAGVSAHVNAQRVADFYRDRLHRNGIDDAGMDLASAVNCLYRSTSTTPHAWINAIWWKRRMWYGQNVVDGRLVSLARHLEIIAHELTHGVVEFSSNLVYQGQSGALNESLADTMGVIIANWYTAPVPTDMSGWNWQIGPGLGHNGTPLRDLSDPQLTGHPDHMRDYVHIIGDNGGVHINSNIHNKAMHHLLTSADEAGEPLLRVADWAQLVYLGMVRLIRTSTFADMRLALRDAARIYLRQWPALREATLAAIDEAYRKVGVM